MEKTMRTNEQNKEKISPCCLNMNKKPLPLQVAAKTEM